MQSVVNVDIKIFILTVVKHSVICKFSRINFMEFGKKKKKKIHILLERTLAIFFDIY